jgi:two-component system OmpR family sensor kinase
VVTISTRAQLIDQVDERLTSFSPGSRAGGPFRDPTFDPSELTPPTPLDDVPDRFGGLGVRLSDIYQGIIGPDGTLVDFFAPNFSDDEYAPPSIDIDEVSDQLPAVFTVPATDGDVTYRVLVQQFGDITSVTGVPIDDVQATITRLIWVEVLGSLAILAALGTVGWWVIHLGIRPVKVMTETASRIAGGDLGVRVPESAPGTESGELALALNQMLGRIEAATAERAASEERLRQFVSDASHELRTPVTSIRGYAELYRIGALTGDGALDDAMRRTEQEAARIGRLVDDMLTLARSDEQRPHATKPVSMEVLLHDAAIDARATAPEREIVIDVASPGATILGDEDLLRQVLANVVANALVHTTPDVPITLRLDSTDHAVVVEIIDTGQGMTPDVMSRVTERFFRGDPSRSRHRGGSGLGLAIVEATVTAHGGHVQIDSAPGRGTVVRLSFPVWPGTADTTAAPSDL